MTSNAPRNPGTPLAPDWFEGVAVNRTAAQRRAASLTTRRTVKKAYQAAWLLNAIRCIDLTTLAGDDTPDRVARLCAKARRPLADRIVDGLGLPAMPQVGAVCVYPTMVTSAVKALSGTDIPVASVATGFPAGLMPLDLRLAEIRYAVDQGAQEIDIVITRAHVLARDWAALHDEVAAMREACGAAHLKAILATGELQTLRKVYAASMVAMQAGADFIKTSTGKEGVNATLPVSLIMTRAIRDYMAPRRGLQARGRDAQRQGRDRLADPDEGGTGQPLAGARPVPAGGLVHAGRYRAAAGTPRHRALRRRPPPRAGLRERPLCLIRQVSPRS